jgi:quercetin dioxygenase-like cupin family protein
MKRRTVLAAGLTGVLGLAAAGVAFATPGVGATGTTLGRGEAFEKVKTRGNQPYDVVVQQLTIAPGGHTGWHTHPGIAVAVVTAGELTIYDGDDASCTAQVYGAGDVYVDHGYGHVHIGRNEGAVALEIVVTYLDVDPGGPVRIDIPVAPGNCAF